MSMKGINVTNKTFICGHCGCENYINKPTNKYGLLSWFMFSITGIVLANAALSSLLDTQLIGSKSIAENTMPIAWITTILVTAIIHRYLKKVDEVFILYLPSIALTIIYIIVAYTVNILS